jgi:metallophosphoesterase (TIGR03768 family)
LSYKRGILKTHYRGFRLLGLILALILQLQLASCGGGGDPQVVAWPIAKDVYTTAEQQILPIAVSADAPQINPREVPLYAQFGYSAWQAGAGLAHVKRTELAPGYNGAPNAARLLSFFSISDIHIIDKESPAQSIYDGWSAGYGSGRSGAYSPTMFSTTQVLDAVIQTVNALHKKSPFYFGMSLGDDCNNTQYNELRWFIDVLDGKVITPSSGAHVGADTIDYQKPFKAAGLNKAIAWYQVIGNHDQFWEDSAYGFSKTVQAHVGNTILNMGLNNVNVEGYYMGVVDGSTPYGDIIGAGPQELFPTPPTVIADPDRRSLATTASSSLNWMSEFFKTSSSPVGHGFTQTNLDNDFACYSFQPKSIIPLKVIVLDDTCKGEGQPNNAVGCLDQNRLTWPTNELQAGQNNNQLMIIAAHIPVHPYNNLTETEATETVQGWAQLFQVHPAPDATSIVQDVNTDAANGSLLAILHNYPNLILWMSGHRHVNVVTPQPYISTISTQGPQNSFWEVETASLKDFPHQFRTFDIRRNSDNTIPIIITNVDPAVSAGSPAAKSRGYAIGAARVYGSSPSLGCLFPGLQCRAWETIDPRNAGDNCQFRNTDKAGFTLGLDGHHWQEKGSNLQI